MTDMPRASTKLRQLLAADRPLVVPCAFDCVSARLIELAGMPAVMHGGFNTAASTLGLPDVGIMTQTETVAAAANIARAIEIPVIADIDDGFGKPLNVARTITQCIRGSIAGVYMEDQCLPKRCPALGGGTVVDAGEMIEKLNAALLVRRQHDPDFVLIARVHASLAIDFEEGLRRGEQYARAGADLVWIDLGYDDSVRQELEAIAARLGPHCMLVANMTENVGRPLLTTDELHAMGFKLIAYPLTLIMSAARAMQKSLEALAANGTTRAVADSMMPVEEFGDIVRLQRIHDFEQELARRSGDTE